MHRISASTGRRSATALAVGLAAALACVAASSCSRFESPPAAVTGSADLDGLCHAFRPDALPVDHLVGFESLPGMLAQSPVGGTAATDPDAVAGIVRLDEITRVPEGFEADAAAFNAALDRVLAGESPAVAADGYRPAGEAFARHLQERCPPVWRDR